MKDPISLTDIEKAIGEFFQNKTDITYAQLRAKVLSGYMYKIAFGSSKPGDRSMNINTGQGGILLYVDACEKKGIPAWCIAESIICYTDQGPYNLLRLEIKKKEDGQKTLPGKSVCNSCITGITKSPYRAEE